MNPAPSLALAGRSLRLDSRAPFVHLLRFALGALMLIALLYVFIQRQSVGAAGINLYTAVIQIDFFFVSVLGVALFATCITEERREGSLGLMRMAGLNSIGVLAGKSISQLTVAISLLAVQIPFTMFAVTLGGVTNHQIFTGFVILGCYLLYAYGVGLLASTLCRTGAIASRVALVVLLLSNIWPLLWDLLQSIGVGLGLMTRVSAEGTLGTLAVWGSIIQTTQTNFAGPLFGVTAACSLTGFFALFLLAWLLFDFVERRAGRERVRRTLFGADSWGGIQRVPRFSGNALVWKDYRLFVGGRRGMTIRCAAYGTAVIVLGWIHNPFGIEFTRNQFGHSVLALVAIGVVLDLGSLAGRVFRDEIAWQTYSTLLLLPKSVLQISYGKVMGCMTAVFPALCFLVIGMLCSSVAVLLFLGPIVFCYAALLYMLLPLIAYVSLFLQRGAFPLTLFGFSILGGGLYLATVQERTAMCCAGLLLFVVAWRVGEKMHRKIIDRLNELSGIDV